MFSIMLLPFTNATRAWSIMNLSIGPKRAERILGWLVFLIGDFIQNGFSTQCSPFSHHLILDMIIAWVIVFQIPVVGTVLAL